MDILNEVSGLCSKASEGEVFHDSLTSEEIESSFKTYYITMPILSEGIHFCWGCTLDGGNFDLMFRNFTQIFTFFELEYF